MYHLSLNKPGCELLLSLYPVEGEALRVEEKEIMSLKARDHWKWCEAQVIPSTFPLPSMPEDAAAQVLGKGVIKCQRSWPCLGSCQATMAAAAMTTDYALFTVHKALSFR